MEATGCRLDVVMKLQIPVPARFKILACSRSMFMNTCRSPNTNITISADTMSQVTETRVTYSVDKKNQLDVTFCVLYFTSNSCSTCFRQPWLQPRHIPTRGYNITHSSAPDDGHMVA